MTSVISKFVVVIKKWYHLILRAEFCNQTPPIDKIFEVHMFDHPNSSEFQDTCNFNDFDLLVNLLHCARIHIERNVQKAKKILSTWPSNGYICYMGKRIILKYWITPDMCCIRCPYPRLCRRDLIIGFRRRNDTLYTYAIDV
ncbi:hypothetical protein OUZ56_011856 [Daphnia magna]|uniref:Uncharacterized protein n=1 Tax=Daphnia magna TaxID=35525 RepID=A0ABQ9Z1B7_9CRUS|nr:hypothetical protein OUZ56_011856 [Daphnia magna]